MLALCLVAKRPHSRIVVVIPKNLVAIKLKAEGPIFIRLDGKRSEMFFQTTYSPMRFFFFKAVFFHGLHCFGNLDLFYSK